MIASATLARFADLSTDKAADVLWTLLSAHDLPAAILDRLNDLHSERVGKVVDAILSDFGPGADDDSGVAA